MWDLRARLWERNPAPDVEDEDVHPTGPAPAGIIDDKTPRTTGVSDASDSESFDSDLQNGVKEVEAVTTAWDKQSLIIAYIL